jgi:hypothetical protein
MTMVLRINLGQLHYIQYKYKTILLLVFPYIKKILTVCLVDLKNLKNIVHLFVF